MAATLNRDGALFIGSFDTESVLNISSGKRVSSSVSDYETYFKGVKARFIADENYYPYSEEDVTVENGLTLDMGDIPIVQGTEEFKQALLHNLLLALKQIRFVPIESEIVADPSLDLGDGLTIQNVNGTEDSVFTVLTCFTWKFHQGMELKSEGGNTKIDSVSSKESKTIQQIESQTGSGKALVVKTYSNAKSYKVNANEKNIITLQFSTSDECDVVFLATIPIEMKTDGNVILTYWKSGIMRETVTQYLPAGKNIITISNYFYSEANEGVKIVLKAKTEYVESEERKHNAKILSLKDWIDNQKIALDVSKGTADFTYDYVEQPVDTTIPEGIIEQDTIRAMAFSTGVNATAKWDGTFEFNDTFSEDGYISFGTANSLSLTSIHEILAESFNTNKLNAAVLSEEFHSFQLVNSNRIVIFALDESSDLFPPVTQQTVAFNVNDYTEISDGLMKLKLEYQYQSHAETVDEGSLAAVQIMTSDKDSVESVVIE